MALRVNPVLVKFVSQKAIALAVALVIRYAISGKSLYVSENDIGKLAVPFAEILKLKGIFSAVVG